MFFFLFLGPPFSTFFPQLYYSTTMLGWIISLCFSTNFIYLFYISVCLWILLLRHQKLSLSEFNAIHKVIHVFSLSLFRSPCLVDGILHASLTRFIIFLSFLLFAVSGIKFLCNDLVLSFVLISFKLFFITFDDCFWIGATNRSGSTSTNTNTESVMINATVVMKVRFYYDPVGHNRFFNTVSLLVC